MSTFCRYLNVTFPWSVFNRNRSERNLFFLPHMKRATSPGTITSKLLTIPFRTIGRLVGKGGSTIQWLSETFDCTIQILRNQTDRDGNTPVHIRSNKLKFSDVLEVQEHIIGVVRIHIPFLFLIGNTRIWSSWWSSQVPSIFPKFRT